MTNERDSAGDLRERLAEAARQIQGHAAAAQSELDSLKGVVEDLEKRVILLEETS